MPVVTTWSLMCTICHTYVIYTLQGESICRYPSSFYIISWKCSVNCVSSDDSTHSLLHFYIFGFAYLLLWMEKEREPEIASRFSEIVRFARRQEPCCHSPQHTTTWFRPPEVCERGVTLRCVQQQWEVAVGVAQLEQSRFYVAHLQQMSLKNALMLSLSSLIHQVSLS